MNDEEKSPIEKMRDSLYSRNAPHAGDGVVRRSRVANNNRAEEVPEAWSRPAPIVPVNTGNKRWSVLKIFFISSLVFFCIAVAVALYVFFGGGNLVSSKNVEITIQGPLSVAGGEELDSDITILNNNNTSIEGVEMVVEYPAGARAVGDLGTELVRQKETLGTIAAGQSVTRAIKAILFGQKDSLEDIKVSLNYKTVGSNASFSTDKTYTVSIQSSPVTVDVSYPKEVNTGQSVTLLATITSNSNTVLHDVLFNIEYPFGFTPTGANPQALFDQHIWRLGDLEPKEKRVISVTGTIVGQSDEEKVFKFHTGSVDANNPKLIGTDFLSSTESIAIKKPFVDLSVALDDDTSTANHVTHIGDKVTAKISWINNLSVALNDATIAVSLKGLALDRSSISVSDGGFYRSVDDMIVWNKTNLSDLQKIDAGQGGNVTFRFSSLRNASSLVASLRNGDVTLAVTVTGNRFGDNGALEQVSSSVSRTLQIGTDLTLNARIVHSNPPPTLVNTGPIPPKVNTETTYTVEWAITNTFNDVGGTRVTATLPEYVRWVAATAPSSEKISFNPVNRTVTWEVGEIKAATGSLSSPREVAFQIGFTPSLGQVSTAPILVNESTITGQDRFTQQNLQGVKAPLTTKISTDPIFEFGDEEVVQ